MRMVFLLILALSASVLPNLSAQATTDDTVLRETVPAQVIAEAVLAVQEIGNAAIEGKHQDVIDKMYPRYRKRAVKQAGGKEALARTLEIAMQSMMEEGISITSFTAEPALHGFEVPEFDEWLVFVPTTRTIRFLEAETKVAQSGTLRDYQIAIRKKNGEEWTFLNGSTMGIRELRSLFPSLPSTPEELGLPMKEFKRNP